MGMLGTVINALALQDAIERTGVETRVQTAISIGATVLGALMGRKAIGSRTVGRATTTMRGVGRAAREREQIATAREDRKVLEGKLASLEAELDDVTQAAGLQTPSAATTRRGSSMSPGGLCRAPRRPRTWPISWTKVPTEWGCCAPNFSS